MINIICTILVIVSFVFSIINNNMQELSNASITSAKTAFELGITLASSMAFWGGIMKVAQKCGIIDIINKITTPVLSLLFRDIDKNGKAMKAISLNVTANLTGLGNAATPLGIIAFKELKKETHALKTNRSMALFILLNTASIQLMPNNIISLRDKYGSVSPSDCILPIICNSVTALVFGILTVLCMFPRRKKDEFISDNNSIHNYDNPNNCNDKACEHF